MLYNCDTLYPGTGTTGKSMLPRGLTTLLSWCKTCSRHSQFWVPSQQQAHWHTFNPLLTGNWKNVYHIFLCTAIQQLKAAKNKEIVTTVLLYWGRSPKTIKQVSSMIVCYSYWVPGVPMGVVKTLTFCKDVDRLLSISNWNFLLACSLTQIALKWISLKCILWINFCCQSDPLLQLHPLLCWTPAQFHELNFVFLSQPLKPSGVACVVLWVLEHPPPPAWQKLTWRSAPVDQTAL